MIRLALALLLACAAQANAAALVPGDVLMRNVTTAESLDQEFTPSASLPAGASFVIRGTNPGNAAVEVDLRIDDVKSKDWHSRFGRAVQVAPGPFEIRVAASELLTPDKQPLDPAALTRLVLFTPGGGMPLRIAAITVEGPVAAPAPAPAASTAQGAVWLKGERTTARQEFSTPQSFGASDELVVRGVNDAGRPVNVYLRVDDPASRDYFSRYGTGGLMPPGPFIIRAPVSGWVTPDKKRLDRNAIQRLIISTGQGDPSVLLTGVSVENGAFLPPGVAAWRFAPSAETAVTGFETVTPGDHRLTGTPGGLTRTPNDPLLSGGVNGIASVTVPWSTSPSATVSLWTEDQGEWEYFPHSLHRLIKINGIAVLREDFTPAEWQAKIYLRGLHAEAMIDGDSWTVFGQRRAGLVTATVPVRDGHVTVELDSDQPPNNGYLAAMLVEPGPGHAGLDAVEAWRRRNFLERWPVVDRPIDPGLAQGLHLHPLPEGSARSIHPSWDPKLPANLTLRAPRGGLVSLDFMALSDRADPHPLVHASLPPGIAANLRWGKWTYMRRDVGEHSLGITADVLEGDFSRMRIAAGIPRRLNLSFHVPSGANGEIPVALDLTAGGASTTARVTIQVIPVDLPETSTPIGFYMAAPVPDLWFPPGPGEADRLMQCDLKALRAFGITGIAPETVLPLEAGRRRYVEQIDQVAKAGFKPPYFAYQTIKGLAAAESTAGLAKDVARINAELLIHGLTAPIWGIADEPTFLKTPIEELRKLHDGIKIFDPKVQLAGQLNSPKDHDKLDLFDVALVNEGFGLDADDFAKMAAAGVHPWFYNMPDFTRAAGFYGWRAGIEGYLQWHLRAATADPFDPTDGREPDFMLLPPAADRCAAVPSIDAQVIAMADGIQDLEWLQWLDARAKSDPKAAGLRADLRRAIPARWADFIRQAPDLVALRHRIQAYASGQ